MVHGKDIKLIHGKISNIYMNLSMSDQQMTSASVIRHRHGYELFPEIELDEGLLEQRLTRENYVDKFHTLLYYEEHEHARVLKERLLFVTCIFTTYDLMLLL